MIVLGILKWIGIVILAIIALMLFNLAIVLFSSLRYYAEGKYMDEKCLYVRASYLFHLIRVSYRLGEDPRIFILHHELGAKKKAKKKKNAKKKVAHSTPVEQRTNITEPKIEQKVESKVESKVEPKKEPKKKTKSQKGKNGFSFEQLSSIIEFVRNEDNKAVVKKLFRQMKKVLIYIGPNKLRANIQFGMDDPCNTGLILGGISLLPIVYRKDIRVIPVFEEKMFEAEGMMKGHIRMYRLVYYFCCIYFNKANKKFIKDCIRMKEELSNGR